MKKKLIMSSSKWRYLRRHQVLLSTKLCLTMYNNLSEENKKKVVLPRSQYFGWNMSGCHYVSNEKLPDLPDFQLPSKSEVYFEFFFREINSVFAILHENLLEIKQGIMKNCLEIKYIWMPVKEMLKQTKQDYFWPYYILSMH